MNREDRRKKKKDERARAEAAMKEVKLRQPEKPAPGNHQGASEKPPGPAPVPAKAGDSSKYQGLLAWSGCLQAFFTAAGTVVALAGLWYVNAALEVTRDTLHRSERPWLEIGDLPTFEAASINEINVPYKAGIPIPNSGKGPALKVTACFGFQLCTANAPDPIPPSDPNDCTGDEGHENVIFPGSTFMYGLELQPKSRNYFLEAAKSRTVQLRIVGSVWYEDQFGLKHRTSKCITWDTVDGSFPTCNTGSYAN